MTRLIRLSLLFLALLLLSSTIMGCSPVPQSEPSITSGPPNTSTELPEDTTKIDEDQLEAIKTILANEMIRSLLPAKTVALPDAVICETEAYQILRKDGRCYLNLFAGNQHSGEPTMSGCIVHTPYVDFDSLDQIYETLTNGGLSDINIQTITRGFPLDSENGFSLPDPHQLLTVTLPDDLEFAGISIFGESVTYGFRETDKDYPRIGGNLTIMDQLDFKEYLKHFNRLRANPDSYRSAHSVPEINGIAYDCNVPAGVFRFIQYSVQTDSKILFIEESYAIERNTSGAIVSDTKPLEIKVHGYENGYYFSIYINGVQARLPLEFLDSFHISPYIAS